MKKSITITLICTAIFTTYFTHAQKKTQTLKADFEKACGIWKGTLTYLDYSSGKPYSMSADLEVKRKDASNEFLFIYTYPKEKSANTEQTIIISEDEKYIGKEQIESRKDLPDGGVQIVTQKSGKDGNDNKDALIKQIYTIGKTSFSIRKEVLFSDDNKWIKRHEYVFTRS